MNFASDNVAGTSPALLQALADINDRPLPSYGGDPYTDEVEALCREIFEHDSLRTLLVATGTGANALALSALTPPWGAIYCHSVSHIAVDEANAVEAASGGSRLMTIEGEHAKIDPDQLRAAIYGKGIVHHPQPSTLSITQMNERGATYSLAELEALTAIAAEHGLRVHMDGARFSNAIAGLNCSPADMTWRLGVDVLVFGATKNGALAGEIVVCFDPALADELAFRRKRAGQLFSKMRTLSAPLAAYLRDELWLDNARHANAMAAWLAEGLAGVKGAQLLRQPDGNQMFLTMDPGLAGRLRAAGAEFDDWPEVGPDVVRLVTAFNTREEDVETFLSLAKAGCSPTQS